MEIEQAVKILKEEKKFVDKHGSYYGNSDYFDLAIKALEKQIPKKPIISNKYPQEIKSEDKFVCPECKTRVGGQDENGIYGRNHCDECGRKLDWEIDND